MTWSWEHAAGALPFLWRGIVVTVELTAIGSVVAYVLGLLLALARYTRIPVLHQIVFVFVGFIRSTPLLIQAFVFYWVLQPALGVRWSSFVSGVIAIGIHYATYTSEVYRAGIEAVPRGQWEAATALSLPKGRAWRAIILPQAIPRVLPALGNYTISMFKETPLLLAIGVLDVLNEAQQAASETFSYIEPITLAGVFFLAVSYPASLLVRRLERRVGTL